MQWAGQNRKEMHFLVLFTRSIKDSRYPLRLAEIAEMNIHNLISNSLDNENKQQNRSNYHNNPEPLARVRLRLDFRLRQFGFRPTGF